MDSILEHNQAISDDKGWGVPGLCSTLGVVGFLGHGPYSLLWVSLVTPSARPLLVFLSFIFFPQSVFFSRQEILTLSSLLATSWTIFLVRALRLFGQIINLTNISSLGRDGLFFNNANVLFITRKNCPVTSVTTRKDNRHRSRRCRNWRGNSNGTHWLCAQGMALHLPLSMGEQPSAFPVPEWPWANAIVFLFVNRRLFVLPALFQSCREDECE